MTRTAGTRITAWLGIFAICLAVFMPGVNALKNRYLSPSMTHGVVQDATGSAPGAAENLADNAGSGVADIFLADICFGAQTDGAAGVSAQQRQADSTAGTGHNDKLASAGHDGSASPRAVNGNGHDTEPAETAKPASHGEHHAVLASSDGHGATGSHPASGHAADHAAECLYCGFFSHNLPLLLSADLPAMSYGFVSRIALQHQHSSYYARPAFVPLSRAPPVLS